MNRVSAMKWLEIVRFELVYQLRRRSTRIVFALFLFPLIGVTNDGLLDARNREITFNAPLFVAQNSVLMSVVALVLLAIVAGDAATRDVQTRLEPLMHASPVGRAAYVGGRFLGAFTVAALLLAVVPLVHVLVPLFSSGVEAEVVGPFRPAAYFQAYLLLIVPNAFVATGFMFALATLVRHTLGSYVGAALLFAGAQLNMAFVGGALGRWELAKLLDATGVTALSLMARTWSPVELNERLIASDGALLWNRVLWLAMALAVLVLTYRRFDFGGNAGAVRWWQRGRLRVVERNRSDAAGARPGSSTGAGIGLGAPVAVPRAPRDFGAACRVRQTLAIARDSLREMAVLKWLVLPFLAAKVALNLDVLAGMGAGTPVLPTTDRILEPFEFDDMPPPVILLAVMLPIVLAGELVWRERDTNMQALADAAPLPNGAQFVGKLLGLWVVVVALHALLLLTGVLTQVWLGWYDFDFSLYLRVLFGLELADHLLFTLFALSVHVLVNHKHVGHVVVLLLFAPLLGELFGIEHPLLLVGSEPAWRHSPISGFGPFAGPLLWFDLYWWAWGLLLALVTRLFWVRGVERRMRARMQIARRRLTVRTTGALAAALGLIGLVGGFVFYNTNVQNEYLSTPEVLDRLAEYERRYKSYENTPQPQLSATRLNVELHPDRRAADVRGVHRLVNRTQQPIDTIHVAVSSEVETGVIEFSRPARAARLDDDLGHRIYELEEPLQPGDSLELSFEVRHAPRGFPARGLSTAVVENGSFIVMADWIPLIGYQPSRELANAVEREEQGLAARPDLPSLDDLRARNDPRGQERIDLEVVVGTAADQTAVAPGELRGTWERDGRRYFQYATSAPIGNGYAIFSAAYAVQTARSGDVAVEVVHHPAHAWNVPRMIRSMQASIEQFTGRFGPYPHGVLRMVEYPAAGGSLHAASATIWYRELFSLFDPEHAERFDLPFAVVAHETAHQWWCGQLGYARVEGAALLGESLAWYSALGVIEQEHGTAHLQRFLGFMRRAYQDPRSRADVPLLRAVDWYQAYRKGPFAMYALREYVGQAQVDLALRRLLAQHVSHEPPFPVSLDLYRELQAVTPGSLQELLGDLFERNTFWELQTRRATVQETPSGEWRVNLEVVARKVAVDTAGVETDIAMDDLIEIGVFAPAEAGEERGVPLSLAMHRICTGQQTITITVPRQPASAGIDPRHLLIDVEPDDNVVDIAEASPSKN